MTYNAFGINRGMAVPVSTETCDESSSRFDLVSANDAKRVLRDQGMSIEDIRRLPPRQVIARAQALAHAK